MTDALLAELRASAPPAPERLRLRVDTIAAREPQPAAWREWLRPRRMLAIAAPVAVAGLLAVAVGHGLTASPTNQAARNEPVHLESLGAQRAQHGSSGGGSTSSGGGSTFSPYGVAAPRAASKSADAPLGQVLGGAAGSTTATPPPAAKGRHQDYRATMTVRLSSVGRMSDAMKAAINATRAWGGYVVAAEYNVPGRNGDAELVVRIPTQHVQAAIQRFANLGTLAAQDVSIRDVQAKLDTYTRSLLTLRTQIAKARAQLARAQPGSPRHADLEEKIAILTRKAANLRADQKALERRASFATVTLTLTTRAAAAATPHHESRISQVLGDAAGILALELAFGLYALIVAAPIALIALLAFLGARLARRRADDRLLGST